MRVFTRKSIRSFKIIFSSSVITLTVPALLEVGPWYVIVPLVIAVIGFLIWLDRKGM